MNEFLNRKLVIDTHCHFFNLDHIPLYAFLERVNLNFAKIASLFIDLNKLLKEYRKFIVYFESEVQSNIQMVCEEMTAACENAPQLTGKAKILTPLVMDFEKAQKHETLNNQMTRLQNSIHAKSAYLEANDIRIFPFVGIDLRRFNKIKAENVDIRIRSLISDYVDDFDTWCGRRENLDLNDGDIIGIKLYPPLGFDPYPDEPNNTIRERYLAVYKGFMALGLPLTVHCQKESYKLVENKIKNKFTTPKNWEKILGTDGLSNLRLNLAHFGGEDQVLLTLNWTGDDHYENDPEPITYDSINPGSWTWTIIKLLKKHENTFSDISAFNFKDRKAVFSLGWLLCLDRSGEFDELGDYRLEDKLLWGSDYPMILSNFNTYDEMMKGFVSAMDIGNLSYENYETPREKYGENLPNQADLIEKLTEKNPKKFLFGL